MDALRAPLPLRLKPSGEFLKTAHWAVFLTEFHLIGSIPPGVSKNEKARSKNGLCFYMVPPAGIEPTTIGLEVRCSIR